MTKKFWTKSPKKAIDGYSSATPRSTKRNVETPSKKRRGIRVILGCRNSAQLQKHDVDDLHKEDNKIDEVHTLPVEYPHTDLSMSHCSSFSTSNTTAEAPIANEDFSPASEIMKRIQGLKDYIWLSGDILLASMNKVNELTSCATNSCLPAMAFMDSRTVHSDTSVMMHSKEVAAITGTSRVRSWPLTNNDAYFKTAANAQAEELKRIKAKLVSERKRQASLSLLIDNLTKEIDEMRTKEVELSQENAQAAVKTRLMKEKLELQLVEHQEELQKMDAKLRSETEQVITLKYEISRLGAEIIAVTAAMKKIDEAQQEKVANEEELKALAEQVQILEDNLSSECKKNSALNEELDELKIQISNAKAESIPVNLEFESEKEPPRVIDESLTHDGVEHDLMSFNATSEQVKTEVDDVVGGTEDLHTNAQDASQLSCAEEGDNTGKEKTVDVHLASSASGINSLLVPRTEYRWIPKTTLEPDDKSRSTTSSSIHSKNFLGCMRPTVWCAAANHDFATVDDSQVASRDGTSDKHGYSTSFSRSLDSTREKVQKNTSFGWDSTSTQSSESEALEFPLPSISASSIDELSDSSEMCESTEKNQATSKGNKGNSLMLWFRNAKQPGRRDDKNVVREGDRNSQGRILVQ